MVIERSYVFIGKVCVIKLGLFILKIDMFKIRLKSWLVCVIGELMNLKYLFLLWWLMFLVEIKIKGVRGKWNVCLLLVYVLNFFLFFEIFCFEIVNIIWFF